MNRNLNESEVFYEFSVSDIKLFFRHDITKKVAISGSNFYFITELFINF